MKDFIKYDVDVERFWQDDEIAHRDNCFNENSPQLALGIGMSGECVYAQLEEDGDQTSRDFLHL